MSLPTSTTLGFCEFAPQNFHVAFLAYSLSKMTLTGSNVKQQKLALRLVVSLGTISRYFGSLQ